MRQRRILAVEWDGTQLRAAILSLNANRQPYVEATGTSSSLEFPDALTEAVDQLRRAKHKIPSTGIVLTPQAFSTTVDLPVDPKRTLPRTKMHALVRWELEPYLPKRVTVRPIGSILLEKQYMTLQEGRCVLAELSKTNDPPPARRFGEVAIQLGFTSREQLEECLALQQQVETESVACGWSSLGDSKTQNRWPWLVVGIPQSLCDSLTCSFHKVRIDLRAIYPLSVGLLPATRHHLGLRERAVHIDVRVRAPSLPQRPIFWAAVGLLMLAAEIAWMESRLPSPKTHELPEKSNPHVEQELADLSLRRDELANSLSTRGTVISLLLQTLRTQASEEIMLQSVREDEQGRIQLAGWGTSEAGIQNFKLRVTESFELHNAAPPDLHIQRETGPFNLSGYRFGFVLDKPQLRPNLTEEGQGS